MTITTDSPTWRDYAGQLDTDAITDLERWGALRQCGSDELAHTDAELLEVARRAAGGDAVRDAYFAVMDEVRDREHEQHQIDYAHIEPPRWGDNVGSWVDDGWHGSDVGRAIRIAPVLVIERIPGNVDESVSVSACGIQHTDGTIDGPSVFIDNNNGIRVDQIPTLVAALTALAAAIQGRVK